MGLCLGSDVVLGLVQSILYFIVIPLLFFLIKKVAKNQGCIEIG